MDVREKGHIRRRRDQADEDTLMEIALDAGADDVAADGDVFELTCQPNVYAAVKQALEDRNIQTVSAEIVMVPNTTVTVEGNQARQVLKLMEALDDHDDVQKVSANFDMSDEAYSEAQDS